MAFWATSEPHTERFKAPPLSSTALMGSRAAGAEEAASDDHHSKFLLINLTVLYKSDGQTI